jgi:hypothetical protein
VLIARQPGSASAAATLLAALDEVAAMMTPLSPLSYIW